MNEIEQLDNEQREILWGAYLRQCADEGTTPSLKDFDLWLQEH